MNQKLSTSTYMNKKNVRNYFLLMLAFGISTILLFILFKITLFNSVLISGLAFGTYGLVRIISDIIRLDLKF